MHIRWKLSIVEPLLQACLTNGWVGACQDHLVSLENEFPVTLASEDGQLVEAHKVILAGCSTPNLIIWVSNIKLFTLHARITYQASLTKARQL